MSMALNKRDSIVAGSLALFAERGYDATTIPMIASSAGVGAGTIYRYFENKEVLGNTIFQEYVKIFTKRWKMLSLMSSRYGINFIIYSNR